MLGIKGFPAKKALTVSRRMGGERIGRAVGLLADADLDMRRVKQLMAQLKAARSARRTSEREAGENDFLADGADFLEHMAMPQWKKLSRQSPRRGLTWVTPRRCLRWANPS